MLSEGIFNLIYRVLIQDWDYLSHNNTQRKEIVIVSKCGDTVFWKKTQVKQYEEIELNFILTPNFISASATKYLIILFVYMNKVFIS